MNRPISRRGAIMAMGALGLPIPAFAARESITAKIVVEDRRLWVAASIDGSEPMLFVVDTGASSNFIQPDVAKRLKLATGGFGSVGGVGGRTAMTTVVEARNVLIGGAMRQSRMQFSTYGAGRGGDAAGLFAAGLVTAYDSDLDFVNGVWRIWPKGREGTPAGQRIDTSAIRVIGGTRAPSERMIVDAMIDGKTYRLAVDTGAPASILLFPQASTRSGLFESRRFAPQATRGFGGAAPRLSRIVRAGRLELGPLALNRPFVTAMDPAQAIAMGPIDGLLGLPIITLFDIATQVGPGKLWLKRNTRAATADPYAKSGLWLERLPNDGARVASVGGGSPAEGAGIKTGDLIAPSTRFADAVRLIGGEAGSEINLRVDRAGTASDMRLRLADYL